MTEQTRLVYLLPLRLFCGWVFLNGALSKLSGGWLSRPELHNILATWLRDGKPYVFYIGFLRAVVLPHAKMFAWMISFSELLVGAALLAGLFTRVAALVGLFLVTNFFLGRGDGLGANNTAPFMLIALTLALTNPGRVLGLDAALRGRVPRWLT